jgi:hypothetical protein
MIKGEVNDEIPMSKYSYQPKMIMGVFHATIERQNINA